MINFEIKDVTDTPEEYRFIVYKDNAAKDSFGYRVSKADLYKLYTELRDMFKDI